MRIALALAVTVALAACGDTTAPDTGAYAGVAAMTAAGVDAQKGNGPPDGKGPPDDNGPPACVLEEPYVDPDGCSSDLLLRTPDQVVTDLRAALAAEDWGAVACNYHPDAFVIDDQGVLWGRTEIVSGAQSLADLFDGVQPVVTDELVFEDVVRTLYSVDGGWIIIPDGTHTYVIEEGMITRQTTHGIIEFTGPPPDQQ